jgi:ABC-type transport system involved in multi-copper enzyme maturation permease subunit
MRTIWYSLAWKEWHEHKWKLAAVTTVLVATASVPLLKYERESISAGVMMMILCVVPLAIFIGAGASAGERARGTLAFTQALPVALWKVAVQKLLFGVFTCVLPVIVTVALLLGIYYSCVYAEVQPPPRLGNPWFGYGSEMNVGKWLAVSVTAVISIAVSLFLWIAAFGVNRKDEVSAGAWGLLAVVTWWALLVIVPILISERKQPDRSLAESVGELVMAASPGGFVQIVLSERPMRHTKWLTLRLQRMDCLLPLMLRGLDA